MNSKLKIDVQLDELRIFGELSDFGVDYSFIRLILAEIGVEAGAAVQYSTQDFNNRQEAVIGKFEFCGDIVVAAIWLRGFTLVAMRRDGLSVEIALPSGFLDVLQSSGLDVVKVGYASFHGYSWLLENRADFGDRFKPYPPNPDHLPIYSLLAAGFGDIGWVNSSGEPDAEIYFSRIPRVFEAMAARGKLIILIDMSNEGQPFLQDWMDLIHKALEKRGISAKYCALLQQNRTLRRHYENWAISKNIEAIQIHVYDYYPRRLTGLLANQEIDIEVSKKVRLKKFCCLNFTPRPHRTSFVSWLISKNFDQQGLISFSDLNHFKYPSQLPLLCDWFPDSDAISVGFDILKARVPLLLDLFEGDRKVPEYNLGSFDIYDNSYFSIVTETEISDGGVVRITEKTLKPLAMYHPLIVLGNPYSLDILKSYGFKTFERMFDESYDLIEDPVLRVKLVMAEIERVLDLDVDDLHRLYWSLWPDLVFNAARARRVLNEQFRYEIEPLLIDRISLIHSAS